MEVIPLVPVNIEASKKKIQKGLARGKNKKKDPLQSLKNGIWLYFLLIVFEGALRKWVLPGLSNPLLIVRDPIAMWLVIVAMKRGLLNFNFYVTSMFAIGIISLFAAMTVGHGNFYVAIYGARILLLHFPLIFIIGRVFTRDDVLKIGRVLCYFCLPMTILVTLQFYSPQSAWVNRGVGGNIEGAGFTGALGYARPPGTFSFTNGNTLYYSILAPFILYFWIQPKSINRYVLIAATLGLMAAIPLSISRALFLSVAINVIFFLIAIVRKPKYLGKTVAAFFLMLVAFAVLNFFSFFQTAMEAFLARFVGSNETGGGFQGSILDRYFGGLYSSLTDFSGSLFGAGIGYGSNVGGILLTGDAKRVLAEDDWGRWVGELGPILGIFLIIVRVALSIKISWNAYRRLSYDDLLPWLLLSFAILTLPQGEWAQNTALGFSVLIGGLVLASLKVRRIRKKKVVVPDNTLSAE